MGSADQLGIIRLSLAKHLQRFSIHLLDDFWLAAGSQHVLDLRLRDKASFWSQFDNLWISALQLTLPPSLATHRIISQSETLRPSLAWDSQLQSLLAIWWMGAAISAHDKRVWNGGEERCSCVAVQTQEHLFGTTVLSTTLYDCPTSLHWRYGVTFLLSPPGMVLPQYRPLKLICGH